MLQNTCKVVASKKNMVYKIPPRGGVNHSWPAAYIQNCFQFPASEKKNKELLQHADILKTLHEIVRKVFRGKAKIKDHGKLPKKVR